VNLHSPQGEEVGGHDTDSSTILSAECYGIPVSFPSSFSKVVRVFASPETV